MSSNPNVSTRGENVPFSAMRKYTAIANKVAQSGVSIIKLNIGQPDILTPKPFWETVKSFSDTEKTLAYAPSNGRPELIRALVNYYKSVDIDIEPSQVLVTVGGCEALLIVLMAITDVGDEVLCVEPFYSNYRGCAAMSGVTINAVTTRCEDGYRLPSRSEVEACLTPKTRAIIYASPGNPTGTVYTPEEIDMLSSICKDKGLFLVGDEVYREFSYNGQVPKSVMHCENIKDTHAIMLDSASKRYSACGARIGSIVCRNEKVMTACVRLATVRLSAPTLDQVGIAACIDSGEEIKQYTAKVVEEYKKRRDIVVNAIRSMEGASCPCPDGAFYLIAKLHSIDTDHFVSWLLSTFRENNETLLVSPVAGFYKTPGLGEDEIRIAYVLEPEKLHRGMAMLGKALAQYRKEHP